MAVVAAGSSPGTVTVAGRPKVARAGARLGRTSVMGASRTARVRRSSWRPDQSGSRSPDWSGLYGLRALGIRLHDRARPEAERQRIRLRLEVDELLELRVDRLLRVERQA